MIHTVIFNDIVSSEKPLDTIFSGISSDESISDYQVLYENFISKIEEKFSTYPKDYAIKNLAGKYKIAEKLFSRIRVASLLLDALSQGAVYSQDLYNRTVKYFEQLDEIKSKVLPPTS